MVTPKKILIQDLELADEEIKRLREENKRLLEKNKIYSNALVQEKEEKKELADELEYVRIIKDSAEKTLKEVREENKKLKETIKDHQLYEEGLEHRIIEFEELLHWE